MKWTAFWPCSRGNVRTGRAENPGTAISLVSPDEQHHFKIIPKKMGKPVTMIDSEGINLRGY
jgi:ATP-dependent RNA helicase RhlE